MIPSICKANEVGKYLEVAIVVKGKKEETPEEENEADRKKREDRLPTGKRPKGMRCPLKDKCPKTYKIGNDTIGLSQEVRRVHLFYVHNISRDRALIAEPILKFCLTAGSILCLIVLWVCSG